MEVCPLFSPPCAKPMLLKCIFLPPEHAPIQPSLKQQKILNERIGDGELL